MSEQTRSCSKCGEKMHYRLGEFQCGSCDHTEPAAPQKEERSSGAAPRREGWQPSGSSTSSSHSSYTGKLLTPPPDPGSQSAPPGIYSGGYQAAPPPPPPGTVYGQAAWERSEAGAGAAGAQSSLQQEKAIFMWVLGVLSILNILVSIASASLQSVLGPGILSQGTPGAYPPDAAGDPAGSVIFVIAQIIVSMLLAGVALYGQTIWLKWSCIGCQSIGLLFIIIGGIAMLAMLGTLTAATSQVPGGGILLTFIGVLLILQIGLQGWFISLIYRDIQERQYRY